MKLQWLCWTSALTAVDLEFGRRRFSHKSRSDPEWRESGVSGVSEGVDAGAFFQAVSTNPVRTNSIYYTLLFREVTIPSAFCIRTAYTSTLYI